jgi:hypothetical protein
MIRNPAQWNNKTYTIYWVERNDQLQTHHQKFETFTEAVDEARILAQFYPWFVNSLEIFEYLPPGGGLLSWEGRSMRESS